jgi:uncharacterized cofD-like protein
MKESMSLFQKRNIVCFGGGTGLPTLLSGLKKNPWVNPTAIVSMFDSGGGSGHLRDKYGILPPGDIVRCFLALAEEEAAARKLLYTKIDHPKVPGMTGGNVMLMALEQVYGNYLDGIDALGTLLNVHGSVVPVSTEKSQLCATYDDGSRVDHESDVDVHMRNGHHVTSVSLNPLVQASDRARDAIRQADAIVIGPGSLYTTVLPNFLPKGIPEAIQETSAPVIFIGNLLTEGKGMRDVTIEEMVTMVESMIGHGIDHIIMNATRPSEEVIRKYEEEDKRLIELPTADSPLASRVVSADLWTDPSIARHDSRRLAEMVFALVQKENE